MNTVDVVLFLDMRRVSRPASYVGLNLFKSKLKITVPYIAVKHVEIHHDKSDEEGKYRGTITVEYNSLCDILLWLEKKVDAEWAKSLINVVNMQTCTEDKIKLINELVSVSNKNGNTSELCLALTSWFGIKIGHRKITIDDITKIKVYKLQLANISELN